LQAVPFGKHKGLKMAEVPRDYLQWLSSTDLDEDLAYTVGHYLGSPIQNPEYDAVSDQQQSTKCPFCETGHILPKAGSTGCPKCYVKVWLDDRMECIFADKKYL
jgi:hypothetical protein